jgi:hypothetical protein
LHLNTQRAAANETPVARGPLDGPYTHADFVRLVLGEFPELCEDLAEDDGLLNLQMHGFARLVERARCEEDWAAYDRAMRLAAELWRRPDDALLNALNVSFLEHIEFPGRTGEAAWAHLSPELQNGWRAMHAYMVRAAALPRQKRSPKPRRRRR